ncbi:MAG: hypothetical protein R3F56_24295 [Planctomycetota bacterium]
MRALPTWLSLALCVSCGLRDSGPTQPTAPPPLGWRVGLEDIGDRQCLVLRLRTAEGEVAAAATGVRVDLGSGSPAELPFTSQVAALDGTHLRCRPEVVDHSVAVRVVPRADRVTVEVEDTVELPSTLAELSIEFRLLDAETSAPIESFAPQDHPDPRAVAGDVSWRTPLAFVRAEGLAMAVLPDVRTSRPRVLPGALEVRSTEGARIRCGLVAQRVAVEPAGTTCWRDPSLARRVAGQTLGFALDVRLFTDALPRRTLVDQAHDLWQQLVAANPDLGRESMARQIPRLLPPAGAATATAVRFGYRHNALLAAAALITRDEPEAQRAARDLLHLALGAPQRSGMSPTVANRHSDGGSHRGPARPTWSQGLEVGPLPGEIYDATAVAWTRVCGLWATRSLPGSDPDRRDAEAAAMRSATFLLANQVPSGAMPALYEASYMTPVREALADPAVEAGAAALLLAECAAIPGEHAERFRAGAIAAVIYMLRELAPERRWDDRVSLLSGVSVQGNVASPDGSTRRTRSAQNLTFASLAALRLLDGGAHADLRSAATTFLEELTLQQQLWSPLWLAPDPHPSTLIGGFGRHDADATWSDPVQGLAGLAYLHGYRHLGRREFAQRGALALRAALAGTSTSDGAFPSAHGVAAAAAEVALQLYGSAVVDVGGQYAEPIDVLRVGIAVPTAEVIELSAQAADRSDLSVRARFFDLPASPDRFRVAINGGAPRTFSASELAAGIDVRPDPVLQATFAPPLEIQLDRPFTPRLRFASPPPPSLGGIVEVRVRDAPAKDEPLAELTLVPDADDPLTWRTSSTFVPSGNVRAGQSLSMRAKLRGPRGDIDIAATNATLLGPQTVVDVAGPNDIDCLTRDACRRVLFVDGSRLAREVGVGPSALVWQLSIPHSVLELELEILLAGALRLHGNDSLLHEDPASTPAAARRLRVTIADRRLWESGRLVLTFEQAARDEPAALQVAELRTRVSVDPGTVSDEEAPFATIGRPDRARTPDSQLAVLVIPVALTDAPLSTTEDQLATLFFGTGYRRTAGPDARATTGSVREILAAISGGRTNLVGDVAAPLRADFPAIDLADPEARTQLAALAHKVATGRARAYGAVVVVHSGKAGDGELLPTAADEVPIASVAERGVDGSVLAVGQALAAILQARYGMGPHATPASGNFGALTLAGRHSDHRPAAPIGVDLARLGWADVVDVVDDDVEVVGAATQRERRVMRAPTGLPDRGDLFLEVRGGLAEEPDLLECGLLAYWQLPNQPLVRNSRGDVARPDLLRLARGVTTVDAPFEPGAASDLVRRARRLDDLSDPALTTVEGELCFLVEGLATATGIDVGERVGFRLRRLTRSLLASTPIAQVQVAAPSWTPLPLDGVDRGLGVVSASGEHLTIEVARHPLRVTWPLTAAAGRGARVFVRGRLLRGAARLRIRCGETLVFEQSLTDALVPLAAAVDLPAATLGGQLELEVTAEAGSDASLILDSVLTAPRARADRIVARGDWRSERLSDGVTHAPVLPLTTAADGRAELVEPVLIPAGRAMLRLRCGFAGDAPPATAARLDIEIGSPDGSRQALRYDNLTLTRGQGQQPLQTLLLDVDTQASAEVGVLRLTVHAPPDVTLWVVDAEIARP